MSLQPVLFLTHPLSIPICFILFAALASYPLWIAKVLKKLTKAKNFKLKMKGYLKATSASMIFDNLVHPVFEQMVLFVSGISVSRKSMR